MVGLYKFLYSEVSASNEKRISQETFQEIRWRLADTEFGDGLRHLTDNIVMCMNDPSKI